MFSDYNRRWRAVFVCTGTHTSALADGQRCRPHTWLQVARGTSSFDEPTPAHVAPVWEQLRARRLELGANGYEVLVHPTSTLSRIRGDLDVRVPRRSARARASVRRWPWSSRRGRNVQVKLIKMGVRLVRHSRRLIFQLSEVSVPRRLFEGVLDRIGRLSPAPS